MSRTMVGVLRGGTSSEYDLSLKTGAAMINALPIEQYGVRDILIDKQGVWHVMGIPVSPMRALSQVDVVLNGLHGGVGEDGSVGRVLEQAGIPYVGSKPLASSVALNKVRARHAFAKAGLRIPRGLAFRVTSGLATGDMAKVVFQHFPPPYVVKPPAEGASHGIRIVRSIIDLPDILGDALDQYGAALVEEYIRGHQAAVGIIESFRNEELYALPPAHILLPLGARIIERAHYTDEALVHKTPSNFSDEQKQMLMQMAQGAHRSLGLSNFSSADFIVTPKGAYLLEVDTNPGLYPNAIFPNMLEAVGSSVQDLLRHSIDLALAT